MKFLGENTILVRERERERREKREREGFALRSPLPLSFLCPRRELNPYSPCGKQDFKFFSLWFNMVQYGSEMLASIDY
jgi:hypothetical protein